MNLGSQQVKNQDAYPSSLVFRLLTLKLPFVLSAASGSKGSEPTSDSFDRPCQLVGWGTTNRSQYRLFGQSDVTFEPFATAKVTKQTTGEVLRGTLATIPL